MEFYYNIIKEHVASNSLDNAIIELKRLSETQESKDFLSQVIVIESRFNELKSSDNKGVIDKNDYSLELNKIKFSVLQLANEIDKSSPNLLFSQQRIAIKKIQGEKRIKLKFLKAITGEIYEINASPHTEIAELGQQILISFEPNYMDNFLFRENRMLIKVKKIKENGERESLISSKTLIENNLVEGDIISIEFELREDRGIYSEISPPIGPRDINPLEYI